MIAIMRKRMNREDKGFTLIELMVVVLIIAILIAIAIPTFLGARKRAQDRAAQSNVRNAFTAEKVHYTDNQSYTTTIANLTAIEPSLTFVSNGSMSASTVNPGDVYVDVTSGVLVLASKSGSGDCFYLKDDPTSGTRYAKNSTCAAPGSTTVTDLKW
jgi:type IV pilus assembly protein PilA